jgi:hypothetical protein
LCRAQRKEQDWREHQRRNSRTGEQRAPKKEQDRRGFVQSTKEPRNQSIKAAPKFFAEHQGRNKIRGSTEGGTGLESTYEEGTGQGRAESRAINNQQCMEERKMG